MFGFNLSSTGIQSRQNQYLTFLNFSKYCSFEKYIILTFGLFQRFNISISCIFHVSCSFYSIHSKNKISCNCSISFDNLSRPISKMLYGNMRYIFLYLCCCYFCVQYFRIKHFLVPCILVLVMLCLVLCVSVGGREYFSCMGGRECTDKNHRKI